MTENDPPTTPSPSAVGPTPTRWQRMRGAASSRRPKGRAGTVLVGVGGFVLGLIVAGVLLLATPLGGGHGGNGPQAERLASQGPDGGPGRAGPDGGPGQGGPGQGGPRRGGPDGGPGRGGPGTAGVPVIQVQPGGTVIVQPGATVTQPGAAPAPGAQAPVAPAVPNGQAPAAPAAPNGQAPAAPAAPNGQAPAAPAAPAPAPAG